MKDIVLPNGFPSYDELMSKIQDTITLSWSIKDFNECNIQTWLNNFMGEVFSVEIEQRIALWLLRNYTYYNEKEIDHLCKNLYKKFIHLLATTEGLDKKGLLEKMKDLCYIPLGGASESGGFIAYQFRKQAKIGIDRFFYPSSDAENFCGNTVVFIDDVTLSATQAKTPIEEFMQKNNVDSVYLLTIIASDEASAELNKIGIKTVSCIEIDSRDKCFSDNSVIFYKYPDIHKAAKEMCEHYGKKIYNCYPLGYKEGQYLFGFYYNTPNNTLPIFWASKHGWQPLFERKEKISSDARVWKTFEKFI